MRAVVYDRYGPPDVLRLEDVERPIPKEDEVLVKIHATAVTRADCATREANRRSSVFARGDPVFGRSGCSVGAYAECICVRGSARIAHKPTGMSFEEAATICD